MKRRILSIICVLALCLGLLPGTAWAADWWSTAINGTTGTITYEGTTLTVSKSTTGYQLTITRVQTLVSSGELTLPQTTTSPAGGTTYTVTGIGAGAFENRSDLISVTVPDGITIGNRAFAGCTNLKSVTLPSDLAAIPSSLFDGCTSLTAITLPENITSIGNNAFYGCTSLTSITVPNDVTSIGNCAFQGCTSLTSITVPDAVTEIGYNAFYGCTSLKEVTVLAANPPTLGSDVFSGGTSSNLTAIYVPAGSVDAYKNANYRSSLASKIQPIGEESMNLDPDSAEWSGEYGTDFDSKTFTITNVGDTEITIRSVELSGDNADSFTLNADNIAGTTLDGGSRISLTVTPKAGLAVGTHNATVTVTAKAGNETETKTADLTCKVTGQSLTGAQVQVASGDYTYTGEEMKPDVTVTLDGKTLTVGKDYTLSYEDNTNAGEATVKATGLGNYTGTATGTFQIAKATLTVSDVAASGTIYDTTDISAITLTHTGTEGTVKLTEGQTLTEGEGTYYWTFTPPIRPTTTMPPAPSP